MVIKEFYRTRRDGVNLYRTYSDEGRQLLQVETGVIYDEAIDVEGAPYSYTEYEPPHAGTSEDPVPYAPGMALDTGTYYIEEGIVYLCVKPCPAGDDTLAQLLGRCLILA